MNSSDQKQTPNSTRALTGIDDFGNLRNRLPKRSSTTGSFSTRHRFPAAADQRTRTPPRGCFHQPLGL